MSEVNRIAKKQYSLSVLDNVLEPLRTACRGYGYALSVHGSLSRDIDLIAIPWVNDAVSADEIANIICQSLRPFFSRAIITGKPTKKPHNRMAYTIVLNDCPVFIDLSVIKPAKETK